MTQCERAITFSQQLRHSDAEFVGWFVRLSHTYVFPALSLLFRCSHYTLDSGLGRRLAARKSCRPEAETV